MAISANSTTAPARPLLPFVFRPSPPIDDPRSASELLEEIGRTIEGQEVCATVAQTPELPPEPLLPAPAPLPSLSSAFSRRRAIFGAVALAAAPTTVLPAAALACQRDTPISAEAAALGAEFDALSTRFDAARAACRDADARYVRPPVPERLFWQKEDRNHFGYKDPGRHSSDRCWWGYPHDIEWLKSLKLVYFDGSPDVAARARGLEIIDLQERYRAAVEAAEDSAGVTAAGDGWAVDATAYFAFVEGLVALRTADPAVMRLKARVVASDLVRHKGLDDYLAQAIEDNPGEVETLALSLVRDMVALEGVSA